MSDLDVKLDLSEAVNQFIDIYSNSNIQKLTIKRSSECVSSCSTTFDKYISKEETDCFRKCLLYKSETAYIGNLK